MTQTNSMTVVLIITCISMLLGLIILGVCLLKDWVNDQSEDVESLVREKYTIRRKSRHHKRPKYKKRMYDERKNNNTDQSSKFYFSYKPKAVFDQFMADDDKLDVLKPSNESEYFNRLKLTDKKEDNQVVDWGRKKSHKKCSNDDAVKRQRESSGRGREKRFSSRKFRKEYEGCRPRTVERPREDRQQGRQVNESNVVTLFCQKSDSDPSLPQLIYD